MAKSKPKPRARALSVAEKFYTDQHAVDMTPEEIAVNLNVSLASIEKHLDSLPKQSRVQKLLSSDKDKGFVSMTGAASMAADSRHNRVISHAEIQKAIDDGDLDRASALQKEKMRIDADRKAADKKKNKHMIHYISDGDPNE